MKKRQFRNIQARNVQARNAQTRKAQTTVFIILAVLIVTFIAIFFFVSAEKKKTEINLEFFKKHGLTPSIENIQSFIIDCHEETSKNALKKIGMQGGYYEKPNYHYDMEWIFIPYYYYEGLMLMPTKEKIQSELASYVDNEINSCLEEIKFPNFELDYSTPSTKTSIKKSEAVFTTELSVKIKHEKDSVDFQLKKHSLTLKSSLDEIMEVADFVTSSHEQNPNSMCSNCITKLAEEKNLHTDFISLEPDTTLVMILENRTMEQPYIFQFLNKYG